MSARPANFRFLNREGKWLDFHWSGLELSPDGDLLLRSAPRLSAPPSATAAMSAPDAPSGIAIDCTGRVIWSDPIESRITIQGDCDPQAAPLVCLSEGAGLGSLDKPRGLVVLREPARLLIVDSGHHRLLFCDLVEFNVREVWGRRDLNGWPAASDAPDGFDTPWAVAVDADSQNIFVLDAGNRRIVKRARTGDVDTQFADRMQLSGLLRRPSALAVSGEGAGTRVFVADLDANAIFVFDHTGAPLTNAAGVATAIRWPGMGGMLALAADARMLYVGDNDQKRILTFAIADDFPFCGDAAGFRDWVTALAVDARRHLLLAQTVGAAPLSLACHNAYLETGVLWSDAISAGPAGVAWNRLRAWLAHAAGASVEFYYALADVPTTPTVDPAAADPFRAPSWQILPRDVTDFLLAGAKAHYLFVGARFSSDRTSTPRLTQLRVDFNSESLTRYLPAIYREAGNEPEVVGRMVSLFQALFEDIEQEVDNLDSYFDAFAAPVETLPWLASWLALHIEQGEPESRIRNSIAGAFRRYRWRGTIEGLRLALLEEAGVHAVISEPISAASFLTMPSSNGGAGAAGTAALGFGAHLPSAEPGGAVLDSTAILDHSYLITDAQFGEPLFLGAAWQFIVEIHRREAATAARLQLMRDIIEREKPAHTMYRLVLLEPRMRVGFQARLGIDTFVGGTPGPGALGERGSEDGLRLTTTPSPRIGTSRLGIDLSIR